MAAPGWATPELAEEWIEEGEGESGVEMSMASIVHEHGFAPGRASTIAEEDEEEEEEEGRGWRDEFGDDEVEWPTAEEGEEGDGMSFTNAHQTVVDKGTFVVHASLAPPRTPGKIKDFFTPLKLESMFEPPPAAATSWKQEAREAEFTFQAPFATSTPLPPVTVPQTPVNKQLQRVAGGTTGTPLKLFQFTYDTYTREHLSALVDSIAVVPSGSASPPGAEEDAARLRSAKRVKLSPASDFSGGGGAVKSDVGATIGRPALAVGKVEGGGSGGESRRDWRERAAEAKAIMEDIRKGDWSTMSSRWSVATPATTLGEGSGGGRYANVRNEAATLMAAIKKRVFSGGSDVEASYYHEPDQKEEEEKEEVSVEQPPVEAPAPPEPTIRAASASSLLRVPSSSSQATTASSAFGGTTTSDSSRPSVPSYTKHPGPPNHMTTIRPADVREALVERVGDMVFDRARGCWVREGEESFTFDDGEDSSSEPQQEPEPEAEAEEEQASSSSEWPGSDSQSWADSEEEETNDVVAAFPMPPETTPSPVPEESRASTPDNTARPPLDDTVTPARSTPAQPVSALKTKTHTTRLKRRSVSFSDGRREGPIVGLESESESEAEVEVEKVEEEEPAFAEAISARSRRLARLVDDLALDEAEEELNFGVASSGHSRSRHASSASLNLNLAASHRSSASNANQSVMPSFVLTHDALLGALTDVEPWTAYWDRLVRVELGWPFTRRADPDVSLASIGTSPSSEKSQQISTREPLSSLARLSEFVPRLLELDVSGNHIAYLTGVPSALRVLEARGCKLSDTCGWSGVRRLERVDVGGQRGEGIRSLTQMSCLGRLTTLIAPHNKISSLDGILGLRHLVKLDLSYNRLEGVVEMSKKWDKLEELVLRGNKKMRGLRVASRGVMLVDVEECGLEDVVFEEANKVRVLRVSNNRLTRLDVSMLGALRTLYADGNALSEVCMARGTRVEAVSLRYNTSTITLPVAPRDAKRLYVSGTLHPPLPTTPFYALTYFEAAHCGLTSLPPLGDVAPNLRTVNLNWNFLEGLGGLKGCGRVRKMSAVGNRVGSVRRLVKDIKAMSELEVVDVRGNPCVGGWYLPLEGQQQGSDAAWRRTLPNKVYAGRLAYRGLVMAGAAHLRILDGVGVTRKERDKAGELVRRLSEKGRGDLGPEM